MFDAITQRELFIKAKQLFPIRRFDEFFPRMFFAGSFFLALSGFGLVVFYMLLNLFVDSENFTELTTGLILSTLLPLSIASVIFATFSRVAVKGTVEGQVDFLEKHIDEYFPLLLENKNQTVAGLVVYVLGILLFATALVYRELTRQLSMLAGSEASFVTQLMFGVFVLLLDFGYIGMILTSLGQMYEGGRVLFTSD